LNDERTNIVGFVNALKLAVYALRIREFYKIKLVFLGFLNLINHDISQRLYVKGNLFSSNHYPDISQV
jgi:hypothetical protein